MDPEPAQNDAALIDTSKPHPAPMYDDAYLGGKDNYAADSAAVAQILEVVPEVRDIARANRAFLQRAVRYLTKEKGMTRFVDIGTGILTAPNVHQVAAEAAPAPAWSTPTTTRSCTATRTPC